MTAGFRRGKRAGLSAALSIAPALVLAASFGSAFAQAGPSSAPPASATGKKTETLPQSVTAEVAGFRSARFGMTMAQVQEAIMRDFAVTAKDIGKLENDLQKTDILSVTVEDMVPGSGRATVYYLFGYASKKLIHVNVVWGRQARHDAAPAVLVNTGRILQQYFVGQDFAREGRIVNKAAGGGQIVLFQGFDEKKRAVQLTLEMSPIPTTKPADGKQSTAKPAGADKDSKPDAKPLIASSLLLSYIENVTNPDIYRVPKGKF